MGATRRAFIGLATAALVLAAAPASASADWGEPEITREPSLVGSAQVGSRLNAVGFSWTGRPTISVNWRWLRCDTDYWRSCRLIDGASSTWYTVTAADLGKRLRALLWVSNREGDDWALSPATLAVAAAPPPVPVPVPVPLPSPPPVVVETPVVPAPVVVTPPRHMRPAPMVRIRGWLTLRGARITLLTVRAPRGAKISVSCSGIGCPRVAPATGAKLKRLRAYEGMFRAGSRIVIRVTRPGFVGKHTQIRIRRGKAPLRRDHCLYPGSGTPAACQDA